MFVTLPVVLAMLLGIVAAPLNGNVAKAEGKTLSVAFSQEPDVLNAYYTNMAFAQWVWFLTESSLWDYDNHLKPVPVLVTEIPTAANGGISKDGKTLTIHLKKDLKWSDGQPLTTDDWPLPSRCCWTRAITSPFRPPLLTRSLAWTT